ncbi:metallophosphoesterase [Chryseobacterium jejuense]|uniref:metallophosphoesterase n=1 Tax=Chryseobacterium jejuense TaxID=445960 RepID=UPI001AE81D98|nr:metallophosphoesterase [Chryseobacterium jejuense]MBP2619096.1 orotate phosphoribosyltransferase [Chryseobacterium jejuense]
MSNPIIIHISDLHISDHTEIFKEKNKNSLLSSNLSDPANNSFIEKFISTIKKDFPDSDLNLLITGDISNIAEKIEYDAAIVYINKIINDLSIPKEKILLLPGDHDVHRDSIKNLLRDNSSPTNEEINKVKFSNFSELYSQIMGYEFSHNDLIVNQIELPENILLLGLNSNLYINQHGGLGKIDILDFDTKIENIKTRHPDKEIFIAFHHNISGTYEDKQSGQWDPENRKYFIESISKHDLKITFYGNEHTPRSGKLEDLFYISESGAIASKSPLGTFRCYEIIKTENKTVLKNHLYHLASFNTILETNGGNWNPITPPSRHKTEIDEFVILDNTNTVAQTEFDLGIPEAAPEEFVETTSDEPEEINQIITYKGEYSDKIYEIVKKKKLFHSGHFHWSETSRAHNWIDITKLLEDKDDLYTVKSSIIDIIETFDLSKNCDLIIGLGYEGNIISSKAAIKYNVPYSSLPYSYRYNDHHDFEKKLYFKNDEKKYKNVIIITDVVNDGRTIRKLMKKENREKAFFDNVEKVTVVSLFYSGERELNIDVLNTKDKTFPENYDWENDYTDIDNIDYYTVAKLKVEKCPYANNNYETECVIYKDKLDCVHLFYDKSKTT